MKNNRKNLFQTIRYHLKEYITNIDDFKYHSRSDCFYYDDVLGPIYSNQAQQFDEKLNNISLKLPEKKIDRFLFDLYFSIAIENENGVQLDYMLPLVSRANKLFSDFKRIFSFDSKESSLFEGKNVCIVQLANTNKDMKEIVPAIISDHIFNKLSERKEQSGNIVQIVSIVIDEAHNILYEGDSARSHNAVLSTFEKIVKEGRKFGCFLAISSQHPSDISQTIISLMHNYFIHKLVNPGDINKIRNAVAYLDSKSLDFIAVLAPGECVVSGTAFQMPTFIYVNQVPKIYRPNSENVKLTGKNSLFSMDSLNNTDDL